MLFLGTSHIKSGSLYIDMKRLSEQQGSEWFQTFVLGKHRLIKPSPVFALIIKQNKTMNKTKLLPRVRIELTTFRLLKLFFVIMRLTRCLLRYRGCYIPWNLHLDLVSGTILRYEKKRKRWSRNFQVAIFEDRWSLFRGDRFTWFGCFLLVWNFLFSKVWFAFDFCLFCCCCCFSFIWGKF